MDAIAFLKSESFRTCLVLSLQLQKCIIKINALDGSRQELGPNALMTIIFTGVQECYSPTGMLTHPSLKVFIQTNKQTCCSKSVWYS